MKFNIKNYFRGRLNLRPLIVAEISANHCGKKKIFLDSIRSAAKNGADLIKIQTYEAKDISINKVFSFGNEKKNIWKLYKKAQTPFSWQKPLFDYAKKLKIKSFSTPFDMNAVDLLEKLNCPIYKIASFEMTDLNLVKKVSQTKKPIIISTGMANLEEITTTIKVAKKNGAKDITLLYCVSNYPSSIADFNLNNIKILKDKFKCRVGISDHSTDNRVAIAAIASGAEVIEKHIALDNQKKGFDIDFSLKGKEIKQLRDDIDVAFKLLGKNSFFRNKSENKSKIFRRSIFTTKNIKKGEKFTKDNIRVIRPGYGLAPKYFNKILNKKCPINIEKFKPIPKKILKLLKLKK